MERSFYTLIPRHPRCDAIASAIASPSPSNRHVYSGCHIFLVFNDGDHIVTSGRATSALVRCHSIRDVTGPVQVYIFIIWKTREKHGCIESATVNSRSAADEAYSKMKLYCDFRKRGLPMGNATTVAELKVSFAPIKERRWSCPTANSQIGYGIRMNLISRICSSLTRRRTWPLCLEHSRSFFRWWSEWLNEFTDHTGMKNQCLLLTYYANNTIRYGNVQRLIQLVSAIVAVDIFDCLGKKQIQRWLRGNWACCVRVVRGPS